MNATGNPRGAANAAKKSGGGLEIIERSFACKYAAWRKLSAARFSSLGFDRISSARGAIGLRKVQSYDLLGKPHLFVELEFRNGRAAIRYSCPPESDPGIRGLHACLLLMQTAYLLPGVQFDGKSLSEFLLPSLECALHAAHLPYEALSKKHADVSEELEEASSQNRRLLQAVEQSAGECLALEERAAMLSERVARLEHVPDFALDELIIDWLSSHKGALNFALFSKSAGVPVARCEERLSVLLKKGVLRKVSGTFQPERQPSIRGAEFQLGKSGLSYLKKAFLGRH